MAAQLASTCSGMRQWVYGWHNVQSVGIETQVGAGSHASIAASESDAAERSNRRTKSHSIVSVSTAHVTSPPIFVAARSDRSSSLGGWPRTACRPTPGRDTSDTSTVALGMAPGGAAQRE